MPGRQRRPDQREGIGELLLELAGALGDPSVQVGDRQERAQQGSSHAEDGAGGDGSREGSEHHPAGDHEEHELARTDGQASPLEKGEEVSLGVDLVDEPAGHPDGVLHQ